MTKGQAADEAIQLAQASVALMRDANIELKEQRDGLYQACKLFLASDVGLAVAALQRAVKRAEETGVV